MSCVIKKRQNITETRGQANLPNSGDAVPKPTKSLTVSAWKTLERKGGGGIGITKLGEDSSS